MPDRATSISESHHASNTTMKFERLLKTRVDLDNMLSSSLELVSKLSVAKGEVADVADVAFSR